MMQTDRIVLRRWQDSDAESLFKYASDPDLGPLAGWPPHKSVEESLEKLEVGSEKPVRVLRFDIMDYSSHTIRNTHYPKK